MSRELRRICWLPDALCLQGRCAWCEGSPPRTLTQITNWAATAGTISNRRGGDQDAMTALRNGLHNNTGPGRKTRLQ